MAPVWLRVLQPPGSSAHPLHGGVHPERRRRARHRPRRWSARSHESRVGAHDRCARRRHLAAGVLAWPLAISVQLARAGTEDSQTLRGAPRRRGRVPQSLPQSAPRRRSYELASADTISAGPIVARDGRPVLMLTSWLGQPLTTAARLERLVRSGNVRYLLLSEQGCRSRGAPSCSPAAQWAVRHSTDVSRKRGSVRRGSSCGSGGHDVIGERLSPRGRPFWCAALVPTTVNH